MSRFPQVRARGERRPTIVIVDGSVFPTGALRSASKIAERLRNEARVLLVVSCKLEGAERWECRFDGVVRIPMPAISRTWKDRLAYLPRVVLGALRLKRLLAESGCDILHVNDFYLAHGVVARWVGFPGRVVTWVQIDPRQYGIVGKVWLALTYLCSTRVVTVSRFMKSRLPWSDRVELVPNFLETQTAGPGEELPAQRRVVCVGNYMRGKGQDHALEAFKELADEFPDSELHFFGSAEGPEKNQAFLRDLVERAKELGLSSRVGFHGFTDEIWEVLNQAYLVVNFSEAESFSLTCLEACQAGRPVVASRSGGPEEILVDGVTGLLVAKEDRWARVEAMRKILRDRELARSMGREGRRYVTEKYGWPAIEPALRNAYGLTGEKHE